MGDLPSGTVTFLLAAVDDGDGLRADASATMQATQAALARYATVFEDAIVRHRGVEVGTAARGHDGGDRRCAVFRSAHDAVTAAIAIQRAVAADAALVQQPIGVKIGVHTGEDEPVDGVYRALVLERCADLLAVAPGGGVLLSETTADLIRGEPPLGSELRYLGEYRIGSPVRQIRVTQVAHPDLPGASPSPSARQARPNNLPAPTGPLVGRERDLRAVRALLLDDGLRVVTLTGPGGIGKTRLALAVADDLLEAFLDGVLFVSLAPISDAALVAPTIGQALGVREGGGRTAQEAVAAFLREKRLLLVLDNFEQVLAAAPDVARLLDACPGLAVLATSREALRLSGEREYAVPPLAVPAGEGLDGAGPLRRSAAVRLFARRARDADPAFVLTDETARAIAEICRRLDGLPLAIELAAARSALLPPEALLGRLAQRLPLLTGGPGDAPERQRTLRDTIAWSYDLLDDAERRLYRSLAVFVGGFTFEAVAAVCASGSQGEGREEGDGGGEDEIVLLDRLSSLIDKSLVRHEAGPDGEPRFGMLETIREYAAERVEEHDEAAGLRRRHAAYFLALAEEAELELRGARQTTWLDRLEVEHDNLRSAMARCRNEALASSGTLGGDPTASEVGLRLAGSLLWFWLVRGHVREGYQWLEAMLGASEGVGERVAGAGGSGGAARGKALAGAGHLAQYRSDYARSVALLEESVALLRAAGDERGVAWSLGMLGEVARNRGDQERGAVFLEESLALATSLGDRWTMYHVLYRLGEIARSAGALDRAMRLYEQSLALRRELGDRRGIAAALHSVAFVARARGLTDEARARFEESLALHRDVNNKVGISICLEGLAGTALEQSEPERAARLLGAVEAICEAIGAPLLPAERDHFDRDLALAAERLGQEAFTAAWTAGRAMSPDRAVAHALRQDALTRRREDAVLPETMSSVHEAAHEAPVAQDCR